MKSKQLILITFIISAVLSINEDALQFTQESIKPINKHICRDITKIHLCSSKIKGQACITLYEPVCGISLNTDGSFKEEQTYSNSCNACNSVTLYFEESCETNKCRYNPFNVKSAYVKKAKNGGIKLSALRHLPKYNKSNESVQAKFEQSGK